MSLAHNKSVRARVARARVAREERSRVLTRSGNAPAQREASRCASRATSLATGDDRDEDGCRVGVARNLFRRAPPTSPFIRGSSRGASEHPTRPTRREGPSGWLARRCGVSASDDEAIAMAMAVSRMCSEAVSAILCAGERFLVCTQCACWARVSPFFRASKTTCGETKKG